MCLDGARLLGALVKRSRLRFIGTALVLAMPLVMAATAAVLGAPVYWFALFGLVLGLINWTTLYVLWKTGMMSNEYEW
jgi:hypothetical protein